MRDFSKVAPTVWRSRKFRSLPDMESRHVYLYLLTCPHGNSAGCFDLHPMYACADLGMTEKGYLEAIDSLTKADLIAFDWDENTVLIVQWEAFNEPTNPKHAIGLLGQLEQASSHDLKSRAFAAFMAVFKAKSFDRDAALRKAIETHGKAYAKAIATETRDLDLDLDLDRDGDQTETRPDQTETREDLREPLRADAALTGVGLAANGQGQPVFAPSAAHLLNTPLMKRSANIVGAGSRFRDEPGGSAA